MANVEVFLDQMPGESRGILMRDGLAHRLIIQRDTDRSCDRLGAVLIGHVVRVEPTLRGAFIDMGQGEPYGFLPLAQKDRLSEGAKIEVEVIAEPRETKGPGLRLIGPSSGEPGLLKSGPAIEQILAHLAPTLQIQTGVPAIRASLAAEEDALEVRFMEAATGLDLAIERTRALISVDIDHRPVPGREGRKARDAVNWAGLRHTARLLGLKSFGGLVVIDLVGAGLHGETVMKSVKTAFVAEPDAVFGPLSRFGLMQLSLPWRYRPIDERLQGVERQPETGLMSMVRQMRLALLSDTASPQHTLYTGPEDALAVEPLLKGLGPRAHVVSEPGFLSGQFKIKEA